MHSANVALPFLANSITITCSNDPPYNLHTDRPGVQPHRSSLVCFDPLWNNQPFAVIVIAVVGGIEGVCVRVEGKGGIPASSIMLR